MREENIYRFYVIRNRKIDCENIKIFLKGNIGYKLFFDRYKKISILVTTEEIETTIRSNIYRSFLSEEIDSTKIKLVRDNLILSSLPLLLPEISRYGNLNPYFRSKELFGTTLIDFVKNLIQIEKNKIC